MCVSTFWKNSLMNKDDFWERFTLALWEFRQFWSPMNDICTPWFLIEFNPLTPVLAITSRDEPRPFFHLWRHPFWPKLASSILNLCRRKTLFQWCPDKGDWPNGARDVHKNAQKVEWKTWRKFSCHYTRLLHRKNCPSRWRFLRSFFLTKSNPSGRSIAAAKRKEIEKKDRWKKKIQKSKSQFWFQCMPEPECHKTWC